MTTKRFYVLSFVVLFLFAVLTSGGCGGSSSDPAPQTNTSSEIPDMNTIFDSTEFTQVMNETEAELREQGVDVDNGTDLPDVHFVMILSDDAVFLDDDFETQSSFSAAHIKSFVAASTQDIARIGQELLPKYESGDVIALYFPTDSSINAMYQALNENITHFDGITNGSGDTYPEIYAIAKRYGLNATHYFSYTVPGSRAILAQTIFANLTSGDGTLEPEDGADDTSDLTHNNTDNGLRQEYLFQAQRYANFIKWVALLNKRAAALDAQAVSAHAAFVQASDSESGNFISMNSQNHDHDFSQIKKGYQAWNQARYAFDINYESGTSWTIFAAHNFADGDDYYLVKQNAFSSPKHVWSGKNGGWDKCHFGQIVNFNVEMQVPTASGSDVAVLTTAPRNVAREGSVTDGISRTIGGKFGLSAGGGPEGPTGGASAEISASLTYSHSQTWATTEWTLTNNSGTPSTKWDADFDASASYDNGDISDAGRHRVEFDSEWIWRVKKSYWSKHKNVPLKAWSTTWTGFTLWEYHWYKSNENEAMSHGISGQHNFNMNRPSHVYVSQKSFTFGKDGGDNSFKMLCNSDYTISSNQSWCQISAEQRIGSDTGTTEREVILAVTPFESSSSTLQTRTATITVRETSTGDTQTITVVQRNR